MNRKLYWRLALLLILLIAATVYKVVKDRIEIAALKREPIPQLNKSTQRQTEAETESTQAPADITEPTAAKSITDTTQDNEMTNRETNTDNGTIADTTKPVRMSPHGFGAYPKVPAGLSIGPFDETQNANQELIGRVLVKLWNEGDRHTGGGVYDSEQGKVYPYYPNVIYVKYETEFNVLTGENEMKISEATSSYENAAVVDAVVRGNIPSGYKLIDVDESGINPYEFLDLPK